MLWFDSNVFVKFRLLALKLWLIIIHYIQRINPLRSKLLIEIEEAGLILDSVIFDSIKLLVTRLMETECFSKTKTVPLCSCTVETQTKDIFMSPGSYSIVETANKTWISHNTQHALCPLLHYFCKFLDLHDSTPL